MLKINKPTLIIAPTLAIKQQWKDRFTELFLEGKQPEWISMDIKQPKFITVTTYQSLHSIYLLTYLLFVQPSTWDFQ